MLCLQKTRFLKYWETQVTASSLARLFKKNYLSIDEKELLGCSLASRLLFSLLIKLICCIKTSETYFIIRKRWYNMVQNNFQGTIIKMQALLLYTSDIIHWCPWESSMDFSRLWTGGQGDTGIKLGNAPERSLREWGVEGNKKHGSIKVIVCEKKLSLLLIIGNGACLLTGRLCLWRRRGTTRNPLCVWADSQYFQQFFPKLSFPHPVLFSLKSSQHPFTCCRGEGRRRGCAQSTPAVLRALPQILGGLCPAVCHLPLSQNKSQCLSQGLRLYLLGFRGQNKIWQVHKMNAGIKQ